MSDTKNIYQRLHAVMKEVSYLRKEKRVENYLAVTHDQVTREVRQWFVAHGILIVPQLVKCASVDSGSKSSKGTPLLRLETEWDVRFVNIDEPQDWLVVSVAAHANDYGDKAPGKAASYAVKTAILKVLMIETGENDESRVGAEMSADTIVAYESEMDAAQTKDALGDLLKQAIAEAKDCQDHYAAKRLRTYAEKVRAKKFNEFMPSETKPEESGQDAATADGAENPPGVITEQRRQQAEETKPEAPAKESGPPATAGMIATIRKAMERTRKTDEQFAQKFGYKLDDMPKAAVNGAIEWARS